MMNDSTQHSKDPIPPRRSLTRLAFQYQAVTWLLTVLLMALGILGLNSMSRREDPDLQGRYAQVIALYPGATAAQVEELVTEKIERTLREVDDISIVTSTSRPGLAVIQIEAADRMTGTLAKLMDDMRERIADVRPSLPVGVLDVSVNDRFTDTSAMILAVTRPNADARELEESAKRLRDRLRVLPVVGEAKLLGEQAEVVTVALSSPRLAALAGSVTVDQITAAIGRKNILPNVGGSVPSGDARLTLSPSGDITNLSELETLVVGRSATGAPVYLRDVATVTRGYADPSPFLVRVNGEPAVAVTITMRKGENIAELGENAREVVKEVKAELPGGSVIHTVNDLPRSVERRVEEFFHELQLAVGIIAVVMFLFMGLRSALLVGVLLPVSLLGTFAAMWLGGRDIQQMSIAALIIALALVVDNSIVILDNIEEKMQAEKSRTEAAIRGAEELTAPLVTANLVAILSFLPLAFLPGGIGDFIRDLGLVTAMSLAVSVVVNLTVMPLLCERFLRPVHGGNPIQRWLDRGVDVLRDGKASLATWSFKRPGLVVAVAALALFGSVSLLPKLGLQFFPLAERDQFVVDVWLPEGRDITATTKTVARVEALIQKQKEVRSLVSYVGQGGPRFYYNITPEAPAANYAQIVVNTTSIEATKHLVPELQAEVNKTIAEARVTVKKLEQGPPIGAPIAIRVTGESVSELRRIAEDVKTVLNDTPGSRSVYDNYGEIALQLKLDVDEDRAAMMGLSSAQVAQMARLAFSGQTVSLLRDGDKEIPIDLRLDPQERDGVNDLRSLYVVSPTAGAIPLENVASVQLAPQEGRIVRRNAERTVTVFAFSDASRLPSAVLADAKKKLDSYKFPAGYHVSYGGESEETGKSFGYMAAVFGAAMVVNVVILVIQFNSFPLVLAILSAVPLGVIGAIPGLYLAHQTFGFMAFLGIAALGGLVTNHTIFIFHYAQEEKAMFGVDMAEALVDASRRRLRPILLTVLLSVGALLPQALSGSNLWPPLDWAIISGLLVSTFLTMIVVPSVYALLAPKELRQIATRPEPADSTPVLQPAR